MGHVEFNDYLPDHQNKKRLTTIEAIDLNGVVHRQHTLDSSELDKLLHEGYLTLDEYCMGHYISLAMVNAGVTIKSIDLSVPYIERDSTKVGGYISDKIDAISMPIRILKEKYESNDIINLFNMLYGNPYRKDIITIRGMLSYLSKSVVSL